MLTTHYERLFVERSATICTSRKFNNNNNKNNHHNNASSRRQLFFQLVRNRRRFLFVSIFFVIFCVASFGFFCPLGICVPPSTSLAHPPNESSLLVTSQADIDSDSTGARSAIDTILRAKFGRDFDSFEREQLRRHNTVAYDQIHDNSVARFDLNMNDVLVFLHMQKTGGSAFDRHLTRDLTLAVPCQCETKKKKKCRCLRPETNNKYWLFSRYSIGWKCGLHADYTELRNCVDRVLDHFENNSTSSTEQERSSDMLVTDDNQKRYFYVTLLRDPVSRFISEFKHVQRGATWKTSRHWCDGRLPTIKELPQCFEGQNWKNVGLQQFMGCEHNLAFNRQTRMLADLSLVGCYNRSFMTPEERDQILLYSAKRNLQNMAYFGLCEEQIASQYLFEKTLDLKFKRPFIQFNVTRSHAEQKTLTSGTIEQIRQLNHLDMELYVFAKELFRQRFNTVRNDDTDFEANYRQLLENSRIQSQKAPIKVRTVNQNFKNLQNSVSGENDLDSTLPDDSGAGYYDEKSFNSVEDYYS